MFRHSDVVPRPFIEQTIVAMEAFFDESGKFHSGPVVSLACVAGNYGDLNEFNPAWGAVLRRSDLTCLAAKDAFRNNTALSARIPAQSVEDRIAALMPFVELIQKHLQLGVATAFDVKAYQSASKRVRHSFGSQDDPIYAAFLRIVLELVGIMKQPGESIGMVCDDEEQTALPFYQYWRRVKKIDPRAKEKLVCLIFADDEVFPALQAADLLSSLARLEARLRFFGEAYDYGPIYRALDPEQPTNRFSLRAGYFGELELEQPSPEGEGF